MTLVLRHFKASDPCRPGFVDVRAPSQTCLNDIGFKASDLMQT